MMRHSTDTIALLLLSSVFTVGLTFATVELPTVVDRALQRAVATPGFDSHADSVSRFKTELFISRFHLRAAGTAALAALVALIVVGFATRHSGLATLGGLALILPVFAQFAGVMFFLAGLGLLNVAWLPVLDVSFEVGRLGLAIRAPYDGLRWLLGLVGIDGHWPLVVLFTASGLLVFFLGTFAWLSARARGGGVAEGWVYRVSRHPQYLGWILWSYGVYLMLERGHYPRRSWGISASLPWLLSTMVILAVALVEELHMQQRHGEAYERYRRSAPFLLPMPGAITRLFAQPSRFLIRKDRPGRAGEVIAVVALYTILLMGVSAVFYGDGGAGLVVRMAPSSWQRTRVERLTREARAEVGSRRRAGLVERVARSGSVGVEPMLELLGDEAAATRKEAAAAMRWVRSDRAVPALLNALDDPETDVRYWSLRSLESLAGRECVAAVTRRLDDESVHVRALAMRVLAERASPAMAGVATELTSSAQRWQRAAAADALGALGSAEHFETVARLVADGDAEVRRAAVVALLRIGDPRARPVLERASADADWEVRLYASEALARLREIPGLGR